MAESIKKFVVRDKHGSVKEQGSFSVVNDVHVTLVPGYGEPEAESVYEGGELYITIRNIDGNGITEIVTDSQEGDEAVNTVTIKTDDNPEGVTLEVRNGSRGQVGPQGPQGPQGDSAIWTGEGEPWSGLKNTTGQSTTEPMTQKAVSDELTIEKNVMALSSFPQINYYISAANHKWHYASNGAAKCLFIPVVPGEIYVLKAKQDISANYAFLTSKKDSYTEGETPAFVTGVDSVTVLQAGEISIETVPTGANWLYVFMLSANIDISPVIAKASKAKENIKDLLAEMDKAQDAIIVENELIDYNDLEKLECYINANNVWAQQSTISDANCVLMPIEGGKNYFVEASDSSYTVYAFLCSTNHTIGESPDFADGVISRKALDAGEKEMVVAPSNATHLYLLTKISNSFCLPKVWRGENISKAAQLTKDNSVGVEEIDLDSMRPRSYYISSDQIWLSGSSGCSVMVPITPNDRLLVRTRKEQYGVVAFLTDYTINYGATAHFAGGATERTVLNRNAVYELTAPVDARYLYVYMRSQSYVCTPRVYKRNIPVNEQVENLSADGMSFKALPWVEEYKNVMIGENGALVEDSNSIVRKFIIGYKIKYYANSFYLANEESFPIAYYDSEDNFLGFDESFAKVDFDKKTTKAGLAIPNNIVDDVAYVLVRGTKTSYNTPWPPFVYEGSWQTKNDVVPLTIDYHTSMVQKNFLACDVNTDPTSGTRIEPTMVESGWAVMWPTSYTRCGKPTQVIAMLHGSNGYVTPSVMSYPSGDFLIWRKRYLQEGYAVVDVNGYGTSDSEGIHYGCPAAVETLDKAFEYLKANYNVSDKLLIHGTSMGGALAQTYTKTYPWKVLAVAMFAPVMIMYSLKHFPELLMPKWGYADDVEAKADGYSHMIGFVPFAKSLALRDGSLVEMEWETMESYQDYEPIERFPVPVRCWHGALDPNVALTLSKYTIAAFRRGGSQATLRICAGEDHSMSGGGADYVIDESIDFFKRYGG